MRLTDLSAGKINVMNLLEEIAAEKLKRYGQTVDLSEGPLLEQHFQFIKLPGDGGGYYWDILLQDDGRLCLHRNTWETQRKVFHSIQEMFDFFDLRGYH